jgi:hypothetical protein
MTKYLVCLMMTEDCSADGGPEEYKGVESVVLCETTRDIAAAIQPVRDNYDVDWQVFEVVGKKTVRRAIIFKCDGNMAYDVVIS